MNKSALTFLIATAMSTLVSSEEIYIDNPFASNTAKKNFFRCFPKNKNDSEAISAMNAITRIAYSKSELENCPSEVSDCRPGQKFFRGTRRTRIKAPFLSTTKARNIANSTQTNGCSYSRISGFNHIVDSKTAVVRFNWRYQKRACDNILGKHNICKSTAKMEHKTVFNSDFTVSDNTRIYDKNTKCFGIPANDLKVAFAALGAVSGGLIGAFTGLILAEGAFKESKLSTSSFLGENYSLDTANEFSDEVGQADDYVMKYERSYEDSGFLKKGEVGSLEYVESGVLDSLFKDYYWEERKKEIKFLRDLSKIERPIYTMRKGDTLWKIAREEYGVAELYLLLEGLNGIRGAELKTGQVIEIPLHHEICEAANYSGEVVRAGDTIWDKVSRGELPDGSIEAVVPRSGDNNLIYPFELIVIDKDTTQTNQ